MIHDVSIVPVVIVLVGREGSTPMLRSVGECSLTEDKNSWVVPANTLPCIDWVTTACVATEGAVSNTGRSPVHHEKHSKWLALSAWAPGGGV